MAGKRQYKRKKGTSISKAKKFNFKGVEYKSGLEKYMAEVLTKAGVIFKYEPDKLILQEGFHLPIESYERQANGKGDFVNRGNKKILPITYTPDFKIEENGKLFWVETKGYGNEAFPNKWKNFKHYVKDMENVTIFKPQNRAECDKTVTLILNKLNE